MVRTLNNQLTCEYRQDPYNTVHLNATELDEDTGYQFRHATFDHSGKFLYAWAFGRGAGHANEALVWSVDCVNQRCILAHLERYPSVRTLT